MEPKQLSEKAQEAIQLLDRSAYYLQKGWCKGTLARTSAGFICVPESAEAVSWCAMGSLIRANYDLDMLDDAYDMAWKALDGADPRHVEVQNDRARSVQPLLKRVEKAKRIVRSKDQQGV